MRLASLGMLLAVAVASAVAAPSASATYQHARAVGKRCSTCHEGKRPDVTNLNRTGLFFMAHRTLTGAPGLAERRAATRASGTPGAGEPVPRRPAARVAAQAAGPGSGRAIFARNCAICHGPAGEGTDKGVTLVAAPRRGKSLSEIAAVAAKGVPGTAMFGFGEVLSEKEIEAVARYVASLRR